ncbi:hypothetical protein [Kitasatospora sp. GAS204B]|uniref:hypothetical protein n=1 Tax=unclassified Kitasatospora TaxID=2633591 RepID=UPI002475B462|nr:hypothetical protein [Kitasatospora sp. GAS204B]MDH6119792.1 hypothetical protein [Kitasatospora sp. GAS204B]
MPERTSILGGDSGSRGILGGLGKRDRIVAAGVALITYLAVGGIPGLIIAVLAGASVFLVTRELPFGRSLGQIIGSRLLWMIRTRTGKTTFVPVIATIPAEPEPEPETGKAPRTGRGRARKKKAATTPAAETQTVRAVPEAIGRIRLLSYPHPAGGELAVLVHSNPGEPDYLSAVMEIEGQPSGITREEDIWDTAEAFGRMLATCAGTTSLIKELQFLTRIVPVDPAAHEWYIVNNHAQGVPRELFESYAGLLGEAQQSLEQHRNYIIARIPFSVGFVEAARDLGGQPGDDMVRCQIVDMEMGRLASLSAGARQNPVRLLGPRRLAALLRSMQDPDYYVDDLRDVDFAHCWQESRAERRQVITNGRWATRVASVPADAVTLEPVHMRWLSPLLIGVQPAVVRTLSVNLRLEPAKRARSEARRDAGEDRGKLIANREGGKITDGGDLSQATASMRRLDDLRPGSGHAGVRWNMCLSVTASEKTMRRASDLITDKAGECGLSSLRWFDGAHDLAQVFTWPLARGMRQR